MDWRRHYERGKAAILDDSTVCTENRQLIANFFEFQEYKLKRQNGLPSLDEACFKTLITYVARFRNVNRWFCNKPWKDLTKEDIKHVYDGLEDGTITTKAGRPFQDRASYYNKIFKSKPFRMAGKETLAEEVIEFSTREKKAVRYVTEESFRRLASVVVYPPHRLLVWLAWDIGENIDSLLKLTKQDFIKQTNKHTGEPEYVIHLAKGKLKRSRQPRSEVTLYSETVEAADTVLLRLLPDDPVFTCEYRTAAKFLKSAVTKTTATTMPLNQPVRWKDLRSGMACHLLRNGWTRDEVNARLGHTPHSAALDAYINFLALDREAPKRRMLGFTESRQRNGPGQSVPAPQPTAPVATTAAPLTMAKTPASPPPGDPLLDIRRQLEQLAVSVASLTAARQEA